MCVRPSECDVVPWSRVHQLDATNSCLAQAAQALNTPYIMNMYGGDLMTAWDISIERRASLTCSGAVWFGQ